MDLWTLMKEPDRPTCGLGMYLSRPGVKVGRKSVDYVI